MKKILIGNPLLLSGKRSEMSLAVENFAKSLEAALKIPVILIDERLSSKIADQSLKDLSFKRKKRTSQIDQTVAALLLQDYLEKENLSMF